MLQGTHALLREWREDDLPFFTQLRNDVDLQSALLATGRTNSERRTRNWLEKRENDDCNLFFVIATRLAPESACGFVELREIDLLHRVGKLGIAVAENQRGTNLAGESLRLALEYGRSAFGLRKVVLSVLAQNERAIFFYRKHGFRDVGLFEQHFYRGGSYHDVLIMEKRIESGAGS